MKITLRTDVVELIIEDAKHEEALDTLGLLINSGVVPTAEIDIYKEENTPYNSFCGLECDCDYEDEEEDDCEQEEFVEFLQGLENILQTVFAGVEEEQKKEEEEKEISAEDFLKVFLGQLDQKK